MKPFHIRYVFCILALFLSLMLLGTEIALPAQPEHQHLPGDLSGDQLLHSV